MVYRFKYDYLFYFDFQLKVKPQIDKELDRGSLENI